METESRSRTPFLGLSPTQSVLWVHRCLSEEQKGRSLQMGDSLAQTTPREKAC